MIRLAVKEDIKKINELGVLIDPDFIKLFNIEKIIADFNSRLYVYFEKEVIGFLHISKLYETVDIINIVVKEGYRGKGIASNLLDYMFSDMDNNVKKFVLEVNVNNKRAFNLYKKFGFKAINTRYKYYHNEDAYLMIKEVK
jgi:ribosomal-protein-alanine N-acetyltransferase